MHLFSHWFTNSLVSCACCECCWCCWCVSTTCCCLSALHACPNSDNISLNCILAAEWAWVLLTLWDFDLLDGLTEGSAITNAILSANADFVCSTSHLSKRRAKEKWHLQKSLKTRHFLSPKISVLIELTHWIYLVNKYKNWFFWFLSL